MQDLIQRIVADVGIDAERADKAVGIILNFLNREGPPEKVKELVDKLPGAETYLAAPAGSGTEGGGFGFGGGAMQAFNELTGAGLDMAEIQGVTSTFMDYARTRAGDDLVGQIVGAIPGLSQFI